MNEALSVPCVWWKLTSTSLLKAFNDGLQQHPVGILLHTAAEPKRSCCITSSVLVRSYGLSSSIVAYYEGQRFVELYNILIVWAERPDPLDQHLQHKKHKLGAARCERPECMML